MTQVVQRPSRSKFVKTLIRAAWHGLLSSVPLKLSGAAVRFWLKEDRFLRAFGPSLLAELAPRLGVTGLLSNGEFGAIVSAPDDQYVFAEYARTKKWASMTNDLLSRFFSDSPHGTYIDVGANIGLTLLAVARFPGVRCIGLEPEPRNFFNLKVNVQLNCAHNNVEVHQLAAFDREATVEMALATANLGDHRLSLGDNAALGRQSVSVRAVRLDAVFQNLQEPIAMKIDTQGAEPFVLSGAEGLLPRTKLLIAEWSPGGIRKMGGDPNRVIECLEANFQSGFVTRERTTEIPARVPIAQLCDNLRHMNLTMRPNEYTDVVVFK